jgi:hypothetical protein
MGLGVYNANAVLEAKLRGQGFKHVSFGEPEEFDLDKQTIYPMAHLSLVSDVSSYSVNEYTYQIFVLDQIDINKVSDTNNTLSLTTNEEDIFHDLALRVESAHKQMQLDLDIPEVSESLTMNTIYLATGNGLAGYELSISITLEKAGVC